MRRRREPFRPVEPRIGHDRTAAGAAPGDLGPVVADAYFAALWVKVRADRSVTNRACWPSRSSSIATPRGHIKRCCHVSSSKRRR